MIASFPLLDPALRMSDGQLAQWLMLLAREVQRLSRFTAAPPLEITRDADGYKLRYNDPAAILVKITSGSNPYAWSEVSLAAGGTFNVLTGGHSGTTSVNPAYERNGNTKVPANTYALLRPGFLNYTTTGQEYLFDWGTSNGWTGTFTAVMVSDVSCSGSTLTVTKKTLTIVASGGDLATAPTFA